jgi:hypothetical protein
MTGAAENKRWFPRDKLHLSNVSFEGSGSAVHIHTDGIVQKTNVRPYISDVHRIMSIHPIPSAQDLPCSRNRRRI